MLMRSTKVQADNQTQSTTQCTVKANAQAEKHSIATEGRNSATAGYTTIEGSVRRMHYREGDCVGRKELAHLDGWEQGAGIE